MKNWKQNTFFGLVAILVLTFALAACNGKNNSGGGAGVSIKNLPPQNTISQVAVSVYNTSTMPTTFVEYRDIYLVSSGLGVAYLVQYEPPFSSPFTLVRTGSFTDTYTGSGRFLVEVGVAANNGGRKITVTDFTNGSAAIDFNNMTDVNSMPRE